MKTDVNGVVTHVSRMRLYVVYTILRAKWAEIEGVHIFLKHCKLGKISVTLQKESFKTFVLFPPPLKDMEVYKMCVYLHRRQ